MLVMLFVWFVPVVIWEKAVTVAVTVSATNCVLVGVFGACTRTRVKQWCTFIGCLLGSYRGRELCG